MSLTIKCIFACLIMIGVDLVSRTSNYFISALFLSFPGLSMIAYWFMYKEQGASKVSGTTAFALLSQVPFCLFLITMHLMVQKHGIVSSIIVSGIVWAAAASAAVWLWRNVLHQA